MLQDAILVHSDSRDEQLLGQARSNHRHQTAGELHVERGGVDARKDGDDGTAASARELDGWNAHLCGQRTEQVAVRDAVGARRQNAGLNDVERTEQMRWEEAQKFFRIYKRKPLHIEGAVQRDSDVRIKP